MLQRILIIGSPGAGKSTFARKLRDRTGLPLCYLDMLFHSREEADAWLENGRPTGKERREYAKW